MADKYDTSIKLGLDADISGGVQTEKQLEKVRAQAKKLEQGTKSGGASMEQSFGKATRAVGLFRRALTGFGVLTAITGLIAAIGKLKESFGAAKKEADALAKARANAEHKDAVEALAKSYDALTEATRKAADATKHANEMQDIATKNARELEDANINLAEQRELAAVDSSDPAAAEKRAAISARYAAQRGALSSSRSREDLNTERSRLRSEASANRAAAGKIVASTAEDDRLIAAAQKRLQAAGERATSDNEEDAQGFWENAGANFKRVVTLDWGRLGETSTQAGDKIRLQARAEAESLREEIKRLQEQRKSKLKEAERLRTDAARLDERAGLIGGALDVVDVQETASAMSSQRGVEAANRSLGKKQAKAAADAATIAQGPARIAALQKQIAATEAQALAAQQADAKEQMDAVLAQSALDSFNSSGHRRNGTGVQARRGALEADVERETREATQSRAQLATTLATLSATLRGLNSDLKKVQREVEAATKRQAAVNDEAPEG